MSTLENLSGKKFNKLTVIERDTSHINRPYWFCKCDCGSVVSVRADLLKSGNTKACGCEYFKHGQALQNNHSRLYSIYHGMKKRCYNSSCKSYKFYGGNGITISDAWLGEHGFIAFRDWSLANGYSDDLTIDRIDSSLSYSPENCRWVTQVSQANNKRNNLQITYLGKTQSLSAWCRELNLDYSKVRQRVHNGKPFELAIMNATL